MIEVQKKMYAKTDTKDKNRVKQKENNGSCSV